MKRFALSLALILATLMPSQVSGLTPTPTPCAGTNGFLRFDGVNDFVETADFASFPTTALTWMAWVRVRAPGIYSGREIACKWDGGTSPPFQFRIQTCCGGNEGIFFGAVSWPNLGGASVLTANNAYTVRCAGGSNDGTACTQDSDCTGGGTCSEGEWHHVALVWQGGGSPSQKIYVDGADATATLNGTVPSSIADGTTSMQIGGCASTGGFNKVDLDEVRLYNRALSLSEVQTAYSSGFGSCGASSETGLVAGYHYDDGSGGTAADYSGNGLAGTLRPAGDAATWGTAEKVCCANTPAASPTSTSTPTSTGTPTRTPTATNTALPTATLTPTNTPAVSFTPSLTPTITQTRTITPTFTSTPSRTSTATSTTTPTAGATNTPGGTKLCRGGALQGIPCSTDSDCGSGNICTHLGHPRYCKPSPRYCYLSSTTPCDDNLDCPGYAGVEAQWAGTGDFCLFEGMCVGGANHGRRTGNCPGGTSTSFSLLPCSVDSDCGVCAGGYNRGAPCTADGQCPGSTCNLSAGTCDNGIEQCELAWNTERSGVSNDTVADAVIANHTVESCRGNAITDRSLGNGQGKGVAFDPVGNHLYIADHAAQQSRLLVFDIAGYSADYGAATSFWGTYDSTHGYWNRLPGDLTVDSFLNYTASTLVGGQGHFKRGLAYDPNGYVWVTDQYRVLRFGANDSTNAQASLALGVTTLTDLSRPDVDGGGLPQPANLGFAADVAVAKRCVGGTNNGSRCSVNGDCNSGDCGTTVAVADSNYNRVSVWTHSPTSNGQAATIWLGQASNVPGNCTTTAAGLCWPMGVEFDTAGNLWVADEHNHRVVRYPKTFTTGTSADLVFGQTNMTSATGATTSTGLRNPRAVAFLADGSPVVADSENGRVVVYPTPNPTPTVNWGLAAVKVIGEPNLTTAQTALSSNGTSCDRFCNPNDLAVDTGNGLWVVDACNSRALKFDGSNLPAANAAAVTRLGQPSCGARAPGTGNAVGPANTHAGSNAAGIAFLPGGQVCVGERSSNRILCWNSWATARSGDVPADTVIGQSDFTSANLSPNWLPNRGAASPSQGSLSAPGYMSANSTRLAVADSGNNRALLYIAPVASGANTNLAADVYGQATFNSSTPSSAADGLNGPRSAKMDSAGNLWVADTGNGRVVMYCRTAGSLGICTAGNSGDHTADLVLGKASTSSGFSASDCNNPSESTLCMPVDVVPDIGRNRVFVSDQGPNSAGRVVRYSGPFANGMNGSVFIGESTGAATTYDSRGICAGGARNGQKCGPVYATQNDDPRTTAPSICVGGSNNNGGCAIDADCPGGGTCKYRTFCVGGSNDEGSCTGASDCPGGGCGCGTGGYCDNSRVFLNPGPIAVHPTRDILWVQRGAGAAEFIGPFSSGMKASRVGGQNTTHGFGRYSSGYITCQWCTQQGGLAFESSTGDLYVLQGCDSEGMGGVMVLLDPSLPGATPTPSVTRTPTLTPTVTRTPSITQTPTATHTPTRTLTPVATPTAGGPPTSTPTITRSPTATATATPTPTRTPTVTVTVGINPTAAAVRTPYAANPSDTDAVLFFLRCKTDGSGARACINMPITSIDPTFLQNGDFWCRQSGRCCVMIQGVKRCWDTIADTSSGQEF